MVKIMDMFRDKDSTTQEMISCVHKHGVCVVPNYLSEDELISLRTEFDSIIARKGTDGFLEHTNRGYIDAMTAAGDVLDDSNFGAIKSLVRRPSLEAMTKEFFSCDYIYPEKIYVIESRQTPEGYGDLPYRMHFDKIHMLKFFFLLDETDEKCGPTWVVPGEQEKYFEIRKTWMDSGRDRKKINNCIVGQDEKSVPLVGSAGTLAIFDTDTPHKAGKVFDDNIRRVIRLDTMSVSYSGIILKQHAKKSWRKKLMHKIKKIF